MCKRDKKKWWSARQRRSVPSGCIGVFVGNVLLRNIIFLYGTCSSLNQHKPHSSALWELCCLRLLSISLYILIYLVMYFLFTWYVCTITQHLMISFVRETLMRVTKSFQFLHCGAYVWKVSLSATQNTPLFGHGLERGTEQMWFESHLSVISF